MAEYEAYKDSGAEWLGNVPAHWEIVRLQTQLDEVNEKNDPVQTTQILSLTNKLGVVPYEDKGNQGNKSKEDVTDYKIAYPNCIVANSMNILIGSVGLSRYYGCVSPVYYVFRAKTGANIEYLNYLFSMPSFQRELRKYANGILEIRLRVSSGNILKRKVAIPPADEQKTIVDYLNSETERIDAIIAEAKDSIEEYKVWKQAIIDEMILGYSDIHIKLRQLGILKNGINFSHSEETPNIKFLGVGCFKDNMVLDCIEDFVDEHIDFEIGDDYLLSDGDIVFVRSNGSKELVGRSVLVENITYPVAFSGFCIRFRNLRPELIDNRFLLYYFRTSYFKQTLLKYSNDSTNINNLNQEMLNAIYIDAPPKEVQSQIVEILTQRIVAIDSVIREKEALIADLEAYKKSLIFEVVTGKRKVV